MARRVDGHLLQSGLALEEAWRTETWWCRAFATLLGIVEVDAYLAYVRFHPKGKEMTHAEFRPNSDLGEVEPKPSTDADTSRKYVQKAHGAVLWARLRDPIPGFQVIIKNFLLHRAVGCHLAPPRLSRALQVALSQFPASASHTERNMRYPCPDHAPGRL